MKFGNGCWLQQEGIECFAAQEAYFITKKERKFLSVYQRTTLFTEEIHWEESI